MSTGALEFRINVWRLGEFIILVASGWGIYVRLDERVSQAQRDIATLREICVRADVQNVREQSAMMRMQDIISRLDRIEVALSADYPIKPSHRTTSSQGPGGSN